MQYKVLLINNYNNNDFNLNQINIATTILQKQDLSK